MNDKVIELEEYKNMLKNKKGLDDKTITVDDLSLEELEDVNKLYKGEISKLMKEYKILEEENKRLKRLINNER